MKMGSVLTSQFLSALVSVDRCRRSGGYFVERRRAAGVQGVGTAQLQKRDGGGHRYGLRKMLKLWGVESKFRDIACPPVFGG